jgi:metal-responsive CopG/Arc/MetJ family transcriptional regulator
MTNMKTIAISIDEEILADLDRLAGVPGASGFNRSRIVRLALREYLTRATLAADEAREREILRRHRGRLRQQAAALVKEQAKP